MKKYKNKIIIGAIIAAVLAFVFLWGGNTPGIHDRNTQKSENTNSSRIQTGVLADESKNSQSAESAPKTDNQTEDEKKESDIFVKKANKPATEENKPHTTDNTPMIANEQVDLSEKMTEENYDNGKGKYNTEPVPQGKPVPIEPENAVISDKELTCTLSVRCDTILINIAWLDKEKTELVPKNGVIYAEQTVTFYEGESVFNLLVREMKRNKIHLEFENTPIYNSAYIEGIANLYEFDCGELSGWMYKVNGWFPNYGCSRYQLKEGDKVEWVYTCDLGADVGGNYSARNGK